jgi:hypothetical protein
VVLISEGHHIVVEVTSVRDKRTFATGDSAEVYLKGVKEGIPKQEDKDKKGRKIVFNGAQGEFHKGVELN